MSDKEFNELMNLLINLRDSIRAVNCVRRKYPAGIEMLITPQQFKSMKAVEEEIEVDMEQNP